MRVVLRDGEPWFVAKDVCSCLSLSNSRVAVSALDEDEKGVSKVYTLRGNQDLAVISEVRTSLKRYDSKALRTAIIAGACSLVVGAAAGFAGGWFAGK